VVDGSGEQVGSEAAASGLPPILVADDDVATVTFLSRFLTRLGLANPVVTVTDGTEARARLEHLASIGEPPAVVLLDVHMPGASGLEILEWMRGHPVHAGVAVVMLTGSAELDEVNRAYDLGIASYLVKPVGFDALADVLRALDRPWAILDHRSSQDGGAG